MPHLTTIAGRHAADLARRRAGDRTEFLRAEALRRLAASLRTLGLAVLSTHGNNFSTRVRLEHALTDHSNAYALLDELGWRADWGRHGERSDALLLSHAETGARCWLVIHLPHGAPCWEAA